MYICWGMFGFFSYTLTQNSWFWLCPSAVPRRQQQYLLALLKENTGIISRSKNLALLLAKVTFIRSIYYSDLQDTEEVINKNKETRWSDFVFLGDFGFGPFGALLQVDCGTFSSTLCCSMLFHVVFHGFSLLELKTHTHPKSVVPDWLWMLDGILFAHGPWGTLTALKKLKEEPKATMNKSTDGGRYGDWWGGLKLPPETPETLFL